ncbi:MAG: hypothetical protein R3C52_15050 [Hyphomonadaceae bacterium]
MSPIFLAALGAQSAAEAAAEAAAQERLGVYVLSAIVGLAVTGAICVAKEIALETRELRASER